MANEEEIDYLFKIVLVGDTNVGKTNIISQLIKEQPLCSSKPTIGVEFHTKTYSIDHDIVKAQLWDTAGQERYHAITSAYYRGSSGAVIVYDVTEDASLKNAVNIWLKNLRSYAGENIPIMLLGNKTDLKEKRKITKETGEKTALTSDIGFYETSAVSGENVSEAFETFVRKIYEKEKTKEHSKDKVRVRREDIAFKNLDISKKKKSSGCC